MFWSNTNYMYYYYLHYFHSTMIILLLCCNIYVTLIFALLLYYNIYITLILVSLLYYNICATPFILLPFFLLTFLRYSVMIFVKILQNVSNKAIGRVLVMSYVKFCDLGIGIICNDFYCVRTILKEKQ